jgi:hypothetical protein
MKKNISLTKKASEQGNLCFAKWFEKNIFLKEKPQKKKKPKNRKKKKTK